MADCLQLATEIRPLPFDFSLSLASSLKPERPLELWKLVRLKQREEGRAVLEIDTGFAGVKFDRGQEELVAYYIFREYQRLFQDWMQEQSSDFDTPAGHVEDDEFDTWEYSFGDTNWGESLWEMDWEDLVDALSGETGELMLYGCAMVLLQNPQSRIVDLAFDFLPEESREHVKTAIKMHLATHPDYTDFLDQHPEKSAQLELEEAFRDDLLADAIFNIIVSQGFLERAMEETVLERHDRTFLEEGEGILAKELRKTLEGKYIAKKVGPEDLCPCGSGKRFKKCCGKKRGSKKADSKKG